MSFNSRNGLKGYKFSYPLHHFKNMNSQYFSNLHFSIPVFSFLGGNYILNLYCESLIPFPSLV